MSPTLADELRRAPAFVALADAAVARLAESLTVCDLSSGDTLIADGASDPPFAVLLAGQVSVTRQMDDRLHEVARLGPGSILGEMSLLDGGPAGATIIALTDVRAAVTQPDGPSLLAIPGVEGALLRTRRRRDATNRLDLVLPIELGPAFDGRIIRPMWPDDWRLMQAARERISDDSLRKRFFTLPKLHEAFLRRLSEVDFTDQFAWAVLDGDDGTLAGVGRHGRTPEDPTATEIALLVADDLQGSGLGSLLTVAIAASAEAQGMQTLLATALAENHQVQRLLTHYGAVWESGARGQEVEARWPVATVLANARPEHPVEALRAAAKMIGTERPHAPL